MAWVAAIFEGYQLIKSDQNKQAAATYNAMVAKENADIARMRANLNVEEVARQDRYQEGAARAAMAGSGVITSTGSPMDVLAEMAINDSFKKQVAYFNGLVNVAADEADSNLSNFLAPSNLSTYAKIGSVAGNYLLDKYGTGNDTNSPYIDYSSGNGMYDVNGSGITVTDNTGNDAGLVDVNGSGVSVPGDGGG
jgi:hypothetical protein